MNILKLMKDTFIVDDVGRLFFKEKRRGRRPGVEAGGLSLLGYRSVCVNQKKYLCHRIVFALTHNRWPELDIDHINGDGLDNRPENLREATKSQNLQNRGKPSQNTTGWKGVYFDKSRRLWCAEITCNNVKHYLGRFEELEMAGYAYISAALKFHGEFARVEC
jgi:hypothetical protein